MSCFEPLFERLTTDEVLHPTAAAAAARAAIGDRVYDGLHLQRRQTRQRRPKGVLSAPSDIALTAAAARAWISRLRLSRCRCRCASAGDRLLPGSAPLLAANGIATVSILDFSGRNTPKIKVER